MPLERTKEHRAACAVAGSVEHCAAAPCVLFAIFALGSGGGGAARPCCHLLAVQCGEIPG